jgi:hypothetical protein
VNTLGTSRLTTTQYQGDRTVYKLFLHKDIGLNAVIARQLEVKHTSMDTLDSPTIPEVCISLSLSLLRIAI